MGSQAPLAFPFFELTKDLIRKSEIWAETGEWTKLCQEVRSALEDHGFFLVIYDDISKELLDEAYAAIQDLFELPVAVKSSNADTEPNFYTYIGVSFFENLTYVDVASPEKLRAFVQRMWPQGNDAFIKTIESLSRKKLELSRLVMNMICESYGVGRRYDDESDGGTDTTAFLMNRYPAPMSKDPVVGVFPHNDRNFVTVVSKKGIDGLEVMNREGEWVPVNLSSAPPSSLFVVAGQALQAWSNGRIIAPVHKVDMTGEEERFSCGLYLTPVWEQNIVSPPELVDDEHPARYRPFVYADFVKFARENRHDKNSLETFAAI